MRSGDQLSQISDDDCYAGGICPSCRLAINKDTGRLKWCVGRTKFWRAWIRYMLLIPAVILPVTIIFIALSRSTVVGKFSLHQPTDKSTERRREVSTESSINYFSTIPNHLDEAEGEDRVILSDVETSFVPTNTFVETKPLQRHKREMHQNNFGQDSMIWNDFNNDIHYPRIWNQYNSKHNFSSIREHEKEKDSQTWLHKNNLGNLDPCDKFREYLTQKRDSEDYRNDLPQLQIRIRDDLNLDSDCPDDEKVEDFLANDNPGVEIEILDSTEADANDYEEANELVNLEATVGNLAKSQMPWQLSDSVNSDKMDEDESQEPEDYEEEDDLPIFDNSWMQMVNLDDKADDFYTFWKGEGNRNSIRKTQAKMMLKYMDTNADPCEDFYQYACGNWQKHNPIPKDKAGYDTFEMLRESLDSVLKELLEEPIPQNLKDSNDAIVKAKHLFQSCMNYEILEERMEKPLLELLDELGGWPILRPDWSPEKFDWLLLIAQLRLYNNDILLSEWVGPDIKNSDQYVIQFDQTSLGLPTRDYFLQPSNSAYLNAYKSYLIKIATLLGSPLENAKNQAEELIQFERKLAKITSSPDERRNVSDLYKRMSIGELRVMIPQIDWHRYLSIVLARPVNVSEPVVIFALQYIQDLVNLISKTSPRTISNYLLWRFVRHRVNNLDDRFQEAKQRFYYILFGREQAPLRWKNCVTQVNSNMGMAVGSMFVRRYFDENSKNDTLLMTQEIQQSFRELLNKIAWIDRDTKKIASEKVDAMFLRIGYPDFILDPELLNERYKDVVIRPDKYFENTLNILHHLTRVEQDRLGSTVNRTLWNTAPAVVNAYYSRNKNQIMFPAGILQPPFYHRYFPRSLNYGGIGVVIGHEITHGFDDKGRLFDKYGNLHRWWKDEAIEEFHQRAQCLIDQYSRYTVTEVNMPIDGVNTQGENIADNGGIKQAFRAYETWLRTNGDENENLPGINATGKQLFFLNFAQVWCGSMRPEATRNKLKTAVHSPGKFRVIGTLSNTKDFAQVFNCPLGSPMNPTKKCSVW